MTNHPGFLETVGSLRTWDFHCWNQKELVTCTKFRVNKDGNQGNISCLQGAQDQCPASEGQCQSASLAVSSWPKADLITFREPPAALGRHWAVSMTCAASQLLSQKVVGVGIMGEWLAGRKVICRGSGWLWDQASPRCRQVPSFFKGGDIVNELQYLRRRPYIDLSSQLCRMLCPSPWPPLRQWAQ